MYKIKETVGYICTYLSILCLEAFIRNSCIWVVTHPTTPVEGRTEMRSHEHITMPFLFHNKNDFIYTPTCSKYKYFKPASLLGLLHLQYLITCVYCKNWRWDKPGNQVTSDLSHTLH